MENIVLLISGIGALIGGVVLGYYARQTIARKEAGTVEARVNQLLADARAKARETLLEAKDRSVKLLEETKTEEQRRQTEFDRMLQRLEQRERTIDQRARTLDERSEKLQRDVERLREVRKEVDKLQEERVACLQEIAKLTQEEARKELLAAIERDHREELVAHIQKLEREGHEELEKRAKEIVVGSLQRYAGSHATEGITTSVHLPSEDMKGRIIGREGRNIKALERATGVDIIVDETPETIIISSFDPVRRQVAKMALEWLVEDGRIQPARIEEVVEKAKKAIDEKIKEAGEAAAVDVGVVGLDPRLVYLLGRLRYRTSYGQNVLLHSIEAAHIAGMIAEELDADVGVAKRGALFHDIGKAVDHKVPGSHIEIGRRILQKFGVGEPVIVAMQSHHEDYPYETVESIIVQVAESISAARPGARRDSLDQYLRRLDELETIAQSFEGVEKVYAIQAGREVRVFVRPENIDDLGAYNLAKSIAQRIEEELRYPGEIKVAVIRETRAVEYAR